MGSERRQLTVMFCDVVGSTALAGRLDPEELRDVLHAYQHTCAEVIQRFDGHIARYVGDGLLVYFGYPQAHEDDAQRAVRAGLGIVTALPHLNARLQPTIGAPLQVRIGIHTGLVVAGEMGGGTYPDPLAIVGQTPNIAARLQELAQPDTVIIGAATYELIQGYFECQHLGSPALKGVSTPVAVYHVLSEGEARSRLEVAATKGLTPLVGRDAEVRLLLERWEQVKNGHGQVLWLSGESGIGKSRLVQVLKERIAAEPQVRIECGCSPYSQHSAFYPVIDLLQRRLAFTREDAPHEKLKKLEDALAHYVLPLQETAPLLATLLSIPLPDDRYPPLTLTPQRLREKTLEAMLTSLLEIAETLPVLCVVDDLHWVDPSTLELLNLLVEQMAQTPTARIFTVLTVRPEFDPPWAAYPHCTALALSRLSPQQVEMMVEEVAGDQRLPAQVIKQLVAKTDGVPLFVEELTKTVLACGASRGTNGQSLTPVSIPVTLHDSLMARLDRLGAVKEVAQLGAVLGREFFYELLQAVSPMDDATLQHSLGQLVAAELLYQTEPLPQVQYRFKHALIQEAAYQSLLKSARQQYHRQIAQVLAAQFSEVHETQPELLAYHYAEASLKEQALPYWQRAGQQAIARSAHVEAIAHLSKGLELLTTLPETPERNRRELTLHTTLGPALIATKGWAAPAAGTTYARARELCRQLQETPQLFPALFGLWAFHLVRGEHQMARAFGVQLVHLAEHLHDTGLLVEAHWTVGCSLFFLGELTAAREHFDQAGALYDPQQHRALALSYGQDPGMSCLCYSGLTLWRLGYPDRARQQSQASLTLARELAHPFSLSWALMDVVFLPLLCREWSLAQFLIEEGLVHSVEHGFSFNQVAFLFYQGAVQAMQGQADGIAQIRQSLAAYRAMGAEMYVPWNHTVLAEAYGIMNQPEEGLAVLAEAFTVMQRTEERHYEAEMYRVKGELTLKIEDRRSRIEDRDSQSSILNPLSHAEAEAEACFLKAIEIARRQQAKAFELRAVMSLSRLWQQQGKTQAARQMLADIYGWFTEGFDTADLQDTRALLAELS